MSKQCIKIIIIALLFLFIGCIGCIGCEPNSSNDTEETITAQNGDIIIIDSEGNSNTYHISDIENVTGE